MKWVQFVNQYRKKHNCSLKTAMKDAAVEWKKVKGKKGGDPDAVNEPEEDGKENTTKMETSMEGGATEKEEMESGYMVEGGKTRKSRKSRTRKSRKSRKSSKSRK